MSDTEIQNICVFCGSRSGNDPEYTEKAKILGEEFGKRKIGLVYGGGTVGIMGVISKTIYNSGSNVLGIIPKALCKREISGENIGTVILVDDMHTRKAKMADNSDAFIALPGGFGTFEELFEVITWAQLGIHTKPIGCLNINGYFEPLKALIDNAISSGFIEKRMKNVVIFNDNPKDLLDNLLNHKAPKSKIEWLTNEQT